MQLNHPGNQHLNTHFDLASKPSLYLPYGDKHIRINISRNTLLAVLFSLILHAVLFFVVPAIKFDDSAAKPAQAIEVSLAPVRLPTKVLEPEAPAQPVVQKPAEPPKKPVTKQAKPKVATPKPVENRKSDFTLPDTPKVKPELDTRPNREPAIKEPPVEQQYTDMASYVRARQAQRQNADAVAANVNAEAAARERGPTEAQMRDERIKRNLNTGTNGIFEITSLGARNATFAFRGWTNDYSTSKRQFFEVEANNGEDVRLLMIRRMIALIREHYQGNFNWESHRLGRSVVQSARPEDNAGLEDFLMMEFFGSNYKTTR